MLRRMALPDALIAAFDRWVAAGRPAQVAAAWNRTSWTSRLPKHANVFDRLGDKPLTRQAATEWAKHIATPKQTIDAFIVAMVWGHGPVGYGAYRTAGVLEGPAFETAIFELAQVAAISGGLASYLHVSERRRANPSFLRYLGPAFGTKFIYFVTKGERTRGSTGHGRCRATLVQTQRSVGAADPGVEQPTKLQAVPHPSDELGIGTRSATSHPSAGR